ncbi:hypothetical protein AKUG0803_UNKNOWN200100 (plasmid) [Apilactobacillus kunkeei]|nr:hypothetical protein AKUG0804_UNKNOWN200090 [Apilactobacillus kunkeei]CAI2670943.1 hypothetical protein AKUG0401_UNKNOWN200080 [Apilactobacillus kunkeei]CAI2672843.1 hypothetical protein AKUG0405_UNKNOWN200100 [Apilactobacillus kunkeei]CAI2674747.1 hypothetical protein AKUG0103_UNKNOWN200100 [Apilactobacillus kunkeei]CAI2675192.1 hypothetical protein AKUG0803_UNKNOWN200100 [Apilactobacillus kunkeei]
MFLIIRMYVLYLDYQLNKENVKKSNKKSPLAISRGLELLVSVGALTYDDITLLRVTDTFDVKNWSS